MMKGFGTSTGKKKPSQHEVRQLAMTSLITKGMLSNKEHRHLLMSGPKDTIPVIFYPTEEQKRDQQEMEMLSFPFGWNKDGKYPQNYQPIVTFSITEQEFVNGGGKTFTHWNVHLWDTERNILTSVYEINNDMVVRAVNMDEGIPAQAADDYVQFREEFMPAFIIWMADQRTVAA